MTLAPRARIARERLVARRVEEHDGAVRRLHLVGADVLRDAARFAAGDVRLADLVEEARLAVVDVTHDGDDRRTDELVLVDDDRRAFRGDGDRLLPFFAARFGERLLFALRDVLDVPAELAGEDLRGVGVERRVDVDVHAHDEELHHQLGRLEATSSGPSPGA